MSFFPHKNRDSRPSEDFEFQVEDVFSIKGRGVVLTGRVLRGEVHLGDTVICAAGDGRRFPCAVWQIEQTQAAGRPGQVLCPETARADGPFGGHYALGVAERTPDDFRPGDRLLGKE